MDTKEQILRDILYEIVDDESKKSLIYEKEIPDFVDDLGFDSIMIVEFIFKLEDTFGLDFRTEDAIDKVWDFNKLIEWIGK